MEIKEVYDTLSVNRIGPKVAVQWGQTGCEGTYAPNGKSGCSNTAMAQIMSYFAYPSTLNITYDGASISSLALNWNQIKMHKDKYIHTNCGTAHESIAQLMRQLGEMNDSDYTASNGTSTYASSVRNSFATLGYTVSDLIDYNQEDFTTQLNNNKLIYMRGVCADGCGGHAWVVDGSLHCTLHVTEWAKYADEGEWVYWEDAGTRSLQYIHINWGWDGSCNGHFSINVFNTQSGVYDNPSQMYGNTENHHFNGGLRYFEVTH